MIKTHLISKVNQNIQNSRMDSWEYSSLKRQVGLFFLKLLYSQISSWMTSSLIINDLVTYLASKNRDRKIMTASHVLCLSCISMAANFFLIMATIRSISFGAIGLVRLCSRSRLTTCVVNSLHAWNYTQKSCGTTNKSIS